MNCKNSPIAAIFAYLKANSVFLNADENRFVESIEAHYHERGFISRKQQNCVMNFYDLVERILKARSMQPDQEKKKAQETKGDTTVVPNDESYNESNSGC